MRNLFFILFFLPTVIFAQTTEFGYFGMAEVMEALPEYSEAQNDYNSLLERCDSEIAYNEEELTRAYVSFLDGQQGFPEPILRKRQKELQDMVDRSVVLRDQLKDWLAQAHDSLFTPIAEKIDAAVERVCLRNNLAYAIDTDKDVYRFVNPNFGVNITDLVIQEVISPKPVSEEAAVVGVDAIEESTADELPATENATEDTKTSVTIVEEEE